MGLIVFANTKGGVGKSTLATHFAVWLFDHGSRVALLDVDGQQSSSEWVREAEPKIAVRTPSTPEDVALEAQILLRTHDFVVADGPGGLKEESRTLLLLADLALFPVSPSILDVRSVAKATGVLKYAHAINAGRPEAKLVLNRMRKRDTISRELIEAAPNLGMGVAKSVVRDLQAYRDAAQQGTVVERMGYRGREAAEELTQLFLEILTEKVLSGARPVNSARRQKVANE